MVTWCDRHFFHVSQTRPDLPGVHLYGHQTPPGPPGLRLLQPGAPKQEHPEDPGQEVRRSQPVQRDRRHEVPTVLNVLFYKTSAITNTL